MAKSVAAKPCKYAMTLLRRVTFVYGNFAREYANQALERILHLRLKRQKRTVPASSVDDPGGVTSAVNLRQELAARRHGVFEILPQQPTSVRLDLSWGDQHELKATMAKSKKLACTLIQAV
ncbi:hypothetical protein OK016_06525 [Vibrio chagasii]|nr:hypothetical protein [Vibrio chagasii]